MRNTNSKNNSYILCSGICEDINECQDRSHECAFRCHNTPGSFRCVCPLGYEVAPDGRHCRDVDECESQAHQCNYECKNLIGTFICACPDGFQKIGLEDECEDVDECSGSSELCGLGDISSLS